MANLGVGSFAVICVGETRYELHRAERPGHYTLTRVGASYDVFVRGGDWGCTCPAAAFKPKPIFPR
jgi:hypothetical protein